MQLRVLEAREAGDVGVYTIICIINIELYKQECMYDVFPLSLVQRVASLRNRLP